ncbi:Wzy polymerase domain-containing protein [Neisseriaceae bacterium ESL0693]|nr:Wzy polymerase domain-containing protein [Neisseriaceae bacterium ESL0693]
MTSRRIDIHRHWRIFPESSGWWLGMLLICIVPFLSSLRVGTFSSFYLESGTLLCVIFLVMLTVLTQNQREALPPASMVLLLFAVLLVLQARLMSLPYASQSDLSALLLVCLAALAWAARAWVVRIGQTEAVSIVAWAILIGTLLQSIVCVMQFTGTTSWIPGMLSGPGQHYVYGQLAQRNHLGHYLMWGVLSLCFLWHQRQLTAWLAVILLVWLTAILGLVGSRTIIAYVLVIGASLLFWRWRAGKAANRLILMMALAMVLVLLFQLVLSPLCAWLFHIDFQSGTARLEQGGFAQSGRHMEWHKAWLIFKTAPWFGHGWGSYAYQGFALEHVYPHDFRQYESKVLFTYCHNLILQLLAETGLVGLLMVAGGFLWVIWPYFKRGFNPAAVLMISMILVTLCHSMLEYPLWYGYFLTVFVLFVALTPLQRQQQRVVFWSNTRFFKIGWTITGMVAIAALLWQMCLYQRLLSVRSEQHILATEQVKKMQVLRQQMYFLQYYVDMAMIEKLDSAQVPLPEWGRQALQQAGRYRPYSNTFLRGIYLLEDGSIDKSKQWVNDMGHYYPTSLPSFLKSVQRQPSARILVPQIAQMCIDYQQKTGNSLNCTTAKDK